MADLFLVKQKVFEPDKPFHRFRPATVTVLVGTKTKAKAKIMAYNKLLSSVRQKFPTADLKFVNIQTISYQDFYKED